MKKLLPRRALWLGGFCMVCAIGGCGGETTVQLKGQLLKGDPPVSLVIPETEGALDITFRFKDKQGLGKLVSIRCNADGTFESKGQLPPTTPLELGFTYSPYQYDQKVIRQFEAFKSGATLAYTTTSQPRQEIQVNLDAKSVTPK